MLLACNVNIDILEAELKEFISKNCPEKKDEAVEIQPTLSFQRVIQRAVFHVQSSGTGEVSGANVLVALFSEKESHSVYLLNQEGITRLDIVSFISHGDEDEELLEENGMPTITWKPLENEQIPKEARGLIIPGGFPEQHAHQLSNSRISLNSIKIFSKKYPIYAECGGMMLLGESIFDIEGREYSMAGILPFKAKKGNLKIGYREATSKNKSPITTLGSKLIGHEFHRWEIINERYNSKINPLWDLKGWNIKIKNEGFCNHLIHASWVHLHWASSPLILENWKRTVMKYA